jgi:hypothetical protein
MRAAFLRNCHSLLEIITGGMTFAVGIKDEPYTLHVMGMFLSSNGSKQNMLCYGMRRIREAGSLTVRVQYFIESALHLNIIAGTIGLLLYGLTLAK